MGVYIKGMEMPTKGYRLILVHADGTVQTTDGETTAVPIPPHGDLIYRDALEQDAQKRLLICDKNDNQFQRPYEVIRAIALAPTIIPAEEGE